MPPKINGIDAACANCVFAETPGPANATHCRKEPPQNDGNGGGIWLTVRPADWCGEFKPTLAALTAAFDGDAEVAAAAFLFDEDEE